MLYKNWSTIERMIEFVGFAFGSLITSPFSETENLKFLKNGSLRPSQTPLFTLLHSFAVR